MLHDEVEVFEAITHEQKVDLLGRARAMVFPIQWPEPFGLVMAEAMACGTPVVACPAGAAVELVENGVTGYLRDSIDDLVAAVGERRPVLAGGLPRPGRGALQRRRAMVTGYEALFDARGTVLGLDARAGFHYGGSANRMGAP